MSQFKQQQLIVCCDTETSCSKHFPNGSQNDMVLFGLWCTKKSFGYKIKKFIGFSRYKWYILIQNASSNTNSERNDLHLWIHERIESWTNQQQGDAKLLCAWEIGIFDVFAQSIISYTLKIKLTLYKQTRFWFNFNQPHGHSLQTGILVFRFWCLSFLVSIRKGGVAWKEISITK